MSRVGASAGERVGSCRSGEEGPILKNRLGKKLAAMIEKDKGWEMTGEIYRYYPSQSERWAGAWVWTMYEVDSIRSVGSMFPATEIARAPSRDYLDSFGDLEIFPGKETP